MKTGMRTHVGLRRCWEAVVLAFFIFGFDASHIQAQTDPSCSTERSSRSAKTTQAVNATFTNQTTERLTVYWLDFEGRRQKWFDLAAGQALEQPTYAGHLWLVAKREGQCLAIFSAPGNFVMGKAPASINTNPPRQDAQPTPYAVTCPKISVSSPSQVEADETITFTASVAGGDPGVTVTYNWTLSDGTISSGQGTSTITADTVKLWENSRSITATVTIGGLLPKCSQSASSTTGVRPKPQPPRKMDAFGAMKLANERSRLDNFAIELQNDPMAKGYIITYGGRTSTPTAAKTASARAWKWLVETRGLDAARIVQIDGGYREKPFTELWIVPHDSTPPEASPTVDPSEVKPQKKAAKKKITKKR